ncbi:MAG TPA: hypothetical protein VEF76_00400 [Patescibacteria group bacterium]|nr:hypothetical protein [Patescibacteria group bacterium]
MYWAVVKIAISACVIAFASWLANKRPDLAGFIIALPISTLLVLAFNYAEFKEPETSTAFALSILTAIPLSLLFFVPFLLAKKFPMPFWGLYAAGVALIVAGYVIHAYITRNFIQ